MQRRVVLFAAIAAHVTIAWVACLVAAIPRPGLEDNTDMLFGVSTLALGTALVGILIVMSGWRRAATIDRRIGAACVLLLLIQAVALVFLPTPQPL